MVWTLSNGILDSLRYGVESRVWKLHFGTKTRVSFFFPSSFPRSRNASKELCRCFLEAVKGGGVADRWQRRRGWGIWANVLVTASLDWVATVHLRVWASSVHYTKIERVKHTLVCFYVAFSFYYYLLDIRQKDNDSNRVESVKSACGFLFVSFS